MTICFPIIENNIKNITYISFIEGLYDLYISYRVNNRNLNQYTYHKSILDQNYICLYKWIQRWTPLMENLLTFTYCSLYPDQLSLDFLNFNPPKNLHKVSLPSVSLLPIKFLDGVKELDIIGKLQQEHLELLENVPSIKIIKSNSTDIKMNNKKWPFQLIIY